MSDPNFIEVNEITDFIGYLKTVSIYTQLLCSPIVGCKLGHTCPDTALYYLRNIREYYQIQTSYGLFFPIIIICRTIYILRTFRYREISCQYAQRSGKE